MSTPWAKIATNFYANPKIIAAGWPAREVFLYLLMRNRDGNYDGKVPVTNCNERVVTHVMGPFEQPFESVLTTLEECDLIRRNERVIEIVGWDEEWHSPMSDAERMRQYRARKTQEKKDGNKPLRTVTNAFVTPFENVTTRREEKRGEEKRDLMSGKPDGAAQDVARIIATLNRVAGSSFKATAKATQTAIRARLDEHTADELVAMVEAKGKEWGTDPKMAKYLRPSTLFNATKCADYVGASKTKTVGGYGQPRPGVAIW